MIEPLTSLIQRELTILSKNFGLLGRTSWELSRLLLRARDEYDMTSVNKGRSGAEFPKNAASSLPDSVPAEPSWIQEEMLNEPSEGS